MARLGPVRAVPVAPAVCHPSLYSAAFTPPAWSLTAISGTVLLLSVTSPATLLVDTSGTGAVVTGAGGQIFSSAFPAGVSCGAAGPMVCSSDRFCVQVGDTLPLTRACDARTHLILLAEYGDGRGILLRKLSRLPVGRERLQTGLGLRQVHDRLPALPHGRLYLQLALDERILPRRVAVRCLLAHPGPRPRLLLCWILNCRIYSVQPVRIDFRG